MPTEMQGLNFPVDFPVSFSGNYSGLSFPVTFPMSFAGQGSTGLSFPVKFPVSFSGTVGFEFPMKFPFRFKHEQQIKTITVKIPIHFTAYTQQYNGCVKLPYKTTPVGKVTRIPFKEKAWWFPGLFLEENIISKMNKQLNVTENIQSLILANFELESTNRVKVSWYGNTVPSLTIMKKSDSDEEFTRDSTYAWGAGEAFVDIAGEDYNIYLQGTSNSGTSAIYTVGGTNDLLVIPDIEVTLNEKIYDLEIDNTATYRLIIDY